MDFIDNRKNKEYKITYVHTDYGMDMEYKEDKDTRVSYGYGYVVLGIKPIKK